MYKSRDNDDKCEAYMDSVILSAGIPFIVVIVLGSVFPWILPDYKNGGGVIIVLIAFVAMAVWVIGGFLLCERWFGRGSKSE